MEWEKNKNSKRCYRYTIIDSHNSLWSRVCGSQTWFIDHRLPRNFSLCREFCWCSRKILLSFHRVVYKPRPARTLSHAESRFYARVSRGLAFARRPIFVSCLNSACTPDITQFFFFFFTKSGNYRGYFTSRGILLGFRVRKWPILISV